MTNTEDQRRRSSSISRPYDPDNGWSDDIENVLESIRHNAFVMSENHKKNYHYYKGQLKYYKIPVIIISGLNSVIAVGLQPYLDQGIISASNCLLALLCGIIGSIELFLGISSGMESELSASKNFYLLAIHIYKTLMLDRERRPVAGRDFLEEIYAEYTKHYGSSALVTISKKTKDKLAQIPLTLNASVSSPSPVFDESDSDNGITTNRNFSVFPKQTKNIKPFNVKSYENNKLDHINQSQDLSDMMEKGMSSMKQYSDMEQTGRTAMENGEFGINSPFGQSLKMVADPFARKQLVKNITKQASETISSELSKSVDDQFSTFKTRTLLKPISEEVEELNVKLNAMADEVETTKKVARELVHDVTSNVIDDLSNNNKVKEDV